MIDKETDTGEAVEGLVPCRYCGAQPEPPYSNNVGDTWAKITHTAECFIALHMRPKEQWINGLHFAAWNTRADLAAPQVDQVEQWKRRAKAFQEGYRDKSCEVTGLEIQLMDLRAHGVDKVTARINESLRAKLLAACIERNEAKAELEKLRATNSSAVSHNPGTER